MHIDFSMKNEQELLVLLKDGSLSNFQRKIVAKKLNDDFSLMDAVVYIPTDSHPHYVKSISETGALGLNLMYGEKTLTQKSKSGFYWVDYHGKRRKSYHKSGRAKLFLYINSIDRIAGK